MVATGTGKIYVVDNKASSICVFQTNGRFVGRFGSRGVGEDQLAGPHFIGINSFGHAVVSDFHNHAVKVRVSVSLKYAYIRWNSRVSKPIGYYS